VAQDVRRSFEAARGKLVVDRRAFVHTLGAGTLRAFAGIAAPAESAAAIHIGNNENPYGPGPGAIAAVRQMAANANRYPGFLARDLVAAIAAAHDVPREYVLISGGSGDVMRAAVYAFTNRTRALITARPSYEAPMRSAQHIGSPVIGVPLTPALRLDVVAMGAKAVGAGLVYVCSPNNPTATVVPAADMTSMIARLASASPDTRVLVDEAYFHYADMPGFDTMIPLVASYPRLIVTRSFSKIHGLAGMRVGYAIAHPDTIAQIKVRHSRSSLSSLSLAAAAASLDDIDNTRQMAARNRSVRAFMVDAFRAAGYRVAPSDANFIMVNIRRDSRAFLNACGLRGVHVGRPFPPMTNWTRVSVGTQEEMSIAMEVFMDVLSARPS